METKYTHTHHIPENRQIVTRHGDEKSIRKVSKIYTHTQTAIVEKLRKQYSSILV